MVGLLLVTHGDLAKSLLNSAALIMGEAPLIESYGLYHGDDVDELKDKVQLAIQRLYDQSEGDGVLILVDLFGGSPYNAAASCLKHAHMECVAGMNFPMILGILENRDRVSLEDLPEIGKQSGIAGIINVRKKIASLC